MSPTQQLCLQSGSWAEAQTPRRCFSTSVKQLLCFSCSTSNKLLLKPSPVWIPASSQCWALSLSTQVDCVAHLSTESSVNSNLPRYHESKTTRLITRFMISSPADISILRPIEDERHLICCWCRDTHVYTWVPKTKTIIIESCCRGKKKKKKSHFEHTSLPRYIRLSHFKMNKLLINNINYSTISLNKLMWFLFSC